VKPVWRKRAAPRKTALPAAARINIPSSLPSGPLWFPKPGNFTGLWPQDHFFHNFYTPPLDFTGEVVTIPKMISTHLRRVLTQAKTLNLLQGGCI
jgi:hypothetical protein